MASSMRCRLLGGLLLCALPLGWSLRADIHRHVSQGPENNCDEDCKDADDCVVLSWSCGGCSWCADGKAPRKEPTGRFADGTASESSEAYQGWRHNAQRDIINACPSYCHFPGGCDLYRDTCTPKRCPELCGDGKKSEEPQWGMDDGEAATEPGKKSYMPEGVAELMAELDSLVGLETVKFQMKELLAQVQFNMERKRLGLPEIGGQSLHMAFMGNPGTGKTILARIVGELMVKMGAIKSNRRNQKVVTEVARADLVAEYVGQTAMKVKGAVDKAKGGVLFIDEAYSLVQGQRDTFGQEALDTLIKEMEDSRDELIVILAGYSTEMNTFIAANPGFKSRIAFHFTFTDYTCPQLVEIGEALMKKDHMGLSTSGKPMCSPQDVAGVTEAAEGTEGAEVAPVAAGAPVPPACGVLRSAVEFVTGCCQTPNCGKPENRANGNGRSVRNVLEASYRTMARRVLNTYSGDLLGEIDKATGLYGIGDDTEMRVPLKCDDFETIRFGGPYTEQSQLKGGDARCAFTLLEHPDIHNALIMQVQEQLVANCRNGNKPITVNVSQALAGESYRKVDMERLHTLLFQDRTCDEAQEMIAESTSDPEGAGSLLQGWDDDSLYGGFGSEADVRPGSQVQELMDELNSLVGLEGVKAGVSTLRDTVEYDMWRKKFFGKRWSLLGQSFHMRFLGNPGTGKTVVARIVGQILVQLGVVGGNTRGRQKFTFTEGSRVDMVGAYLGQTAIKVQEIVKKSFGGVLFIDEAYSLVNDKHDSFGQEAVDSLIKEMEDHREQLVVILAGYHHEMEAFIESNPGFKSRVPFRFEFSDYTCEQLGTVGEMMLGKQSVTADVEAKAWLEKVVAGKTGCCYKADLEAGTCAGARRDNGNGRAVRNILESALRAMSTRVVVAHNRGSTVDQALVSSLTRSDVATAGAEMIADALRTTCKAAKQAVPDLETLAVAPKILGLPDFKAALATASADCAEATRMLEAAQALDAEQTPKASDIEVRDSRVIEVFKELDEMIGLASVKRAMRELYCTVAFRKLREDAGLGELSSQSFHMRFLGNPGTGKTVVARIVGKLLVKLGAIKKPDQKIKRDYGMDDNPFQKPPEDDYADIYGYYGMDEESGSDSKKKEDGELIWNEGSRSDLVAEYQGQTAIKTISLIDASMGGVLFIDEAYSLVTGERDTFGQEAVATLIKEMEDRRQNVIVICAGYEKEMETFFDTNPGFKSRVPFTFHFEDYTCPQLGQIGEHMLQQKQLQLPKDMAPFGRAIHFGTGCCDNLADCETNKNYKGNGRAVRNVIESSIRAMARRLMNAETRPDRSAYTRMKPEDFDVVTKQLVFSQFSMPCGAHGDLDKAIKAVQGSQGALEGVPKDKRAYLLSTVRRLATDSSLVVGYDSMKEVQALGQKCHDGVLRLSEELGAQLTGMCSSSGALDKIVEDLSKVHPQETIKELADKLYLALQDTHFMQSLLATTAPAGGGDPEAAKLCGAKMREVKASKFDVPFDFLVYSDADEEVEEEPAAPEAYGG